MDLASSAGTILSGGLGVIARLVPEALKFFDRKAERKHELDLQDKQFQVLQFQKNTQLEEVRLQTFNEQLTGSIQALARLNEAQMAKTGIPWIDGLNTSVRPIWTYLVLLCWASAKIIDVVMCVGRGIDWMQIRAIMWGADDANMLAMLGTFWFMDRVLTKQKQ
jgi:hypothetical protein